MIATPLDQNQERLEVHATRFEIGEARSETTSELLPYCRVRHVCLHRNSHALYPVRRPAAWIWNLCLFRLAQGKLSRKEIQDACSHLRRRRRYQRYHQHRRVVVREARIREVPSI